jgi:hypothetical protein
MYCSNGTRGILLLLDDAGDKRSRVTIRDSLPSFSEAPSLEVFPGQSFKSDGILILLNGVGEDGFWFSTVAVCDIFMRPALLRFSEACSWDEHCRYQVAFTDRETDGISDIVVTPPSKANASGPRDPANPARIFRANRVGTGFIDVTDSRPIHRKLATNELRDHLENDLSRSVPLAIARAFADSVREGDLRFWYDLSYEHWKEDPTMWAGPDLDNLWGGRLVADSFQATEVDTRFWAVYMSEYLCVFEAKGETVVSRLASDDVMDVVQPGLEAIELTGAPPAEFVLWGFLGLGSCWGGEVITCDSGVPRLISPMTEYDGVAGGSALRGSWQFADSDSDGVAEIYQYPYWKENQMYDDTDGDGLFEEIAPDEKLARDELKSVFVFSTTLNRFVLRR